MAQIYKCDKCGLVVKKVMLSFYSLLDGEELRNLDFCFGCSPKLVKLIMEWSKTKEDDQD